MEETHQETKPVEIREKEGLHSVKLQSIPQYSGTRSSSRTFPLMAITVSDKVINGAFHVFHGNRFVKIYSSVHINESKVIYSMHFVNFLGKYLSYRQAQSQFPHPHFKSFHMGISDFYSD